MRLMSARYARTMNQLVRLAYRDDRVVDAALKRCARRDGTSDLKEVMKEIRRMRKLPTIAHRRPTLRSHPGRS